ncbi:PLP-dependent aminotransferase family protein [Saccharopolyspora sp. K220]|uniref:MocR-like pyridoxine biosynthesis transcription factor PdxR n=1 Tax=Saccharopolyspora soli TaxID=2926618 RepID=UPI001F57D502|nr:PLP-dependent aminotransferase family protein [Saccharopolyspora soli]MCI2417110.1 PLP-dependent aminotransferase family protein [Saccharopolyspora soli]
MTAGWSTSLDLHLDWVGRPDSRKLAESLRTAIRDGRLPAGSRIPSTRALAHDLGVARGTVTRAYNQLVTEGFLLSRQGAPTTVAERLASPDPVTLPARPQTPAARWDFRPGRPDLSSFPRRDWLAASRRALQTTEPGDLDYGDPQGHPALREALTDYLARVRAVATAAERIIICNGYTQALSLLSKALYDQGLDVIDFEDPSLPHLRAIPASLGMAVRGVPVDRDGIDITRQHSRAVVVTPAHQFPLGITMSSARRMELVQLAKAEDRLIIEDDYDGEFRFDRQPIGSLQGMAPNHIAYAGTASKTLAPALRLAWLALPPRLVEPVRTLKQHSGLHAPLFEQLALAELIRSGAYDQHVRRSRAVYRKRRELLRDALNDMRANHRPYPAGISAGLHITLQLDPEGPTEREVLIRARKHSVELEVLGPYWATPGEHPPGVVIGYAAPAEHAFRPALQALVAVLQR